jgi:hypothetical protein
MTRTTNRLEAKYGISSAAALLSHRVLGVSGNGPNQMLDSAKQLAAPARRHDTAVLVTLR